MFHFTPRRIEAHTCICFVALKVYKEFERILKMTNIKISVDRVLNSYLMKNFGWRIDEVRILKNNPNYIFVNQSFLVYLHKATAPKLYRKRNLLIIKYGVCSILTKLWYNIF